MERQEAGKNLAPNQGPMSIVEKFLTDLITKEGREDAFSSVCEDVEYCGIWDEESINGKEAVCLKMVSWCENKNICLTGTELEHRMFSSQADLVMGKFVYGTTDREGRNTKTTVHVMVLCLLENEWKINKLYFSLPYHAGSESPSVYKRSICTAPGPEYCWNSAVVQILPMGLLVLCWCGDGNICYMNKTMLKYLGYCDQKEYERISGNSIYSLLHSDEIASFKLHLEEIKAGGESKSFTCRLRTTGQCYDWLSVRVMLLPTCMRANAILCLCTDISDLMEEKKGILKQQKLLEDARMELNSIIENMPGGVHRCRLSGEISMDFASDGLCQMVGYSRREIEQRFKGEYAGLIYEEDRKDFIAGIEELKEYPHTKILKYRLVHKSGSVFWVIDTVKSVRHSDGMMWAYAVVIDIDNEQNTFKNLESVADSIPSGLAFCEYYNRELHLRYCNKIFARYIGSATDLFAAVFEEDVKRLRDAMEKLSGGDEESQCGFRVHTKNGFRRLSVSAKVVERVGKWIRFTVVLTDVTDEKYQLSEEKVSIRTFGYFDVFLNGKAIPFRYTKSKELLALLVDRRGGFVSSGDIISCLWEEEIINKVTQSRCRKVFLRLMEELKQHGIEGIIESENGLRRIVPEKVDCDLFDYCSGKREYENLFKGAYLTNYSWGEMTLGELASQ